MRALHRLSPGAALEVERTAPRTTEQRPEVVGLRVSEGRFAGGPKRLRIRSTMV